MAWLGYQRVVKSEQFGIWLVRCVYRRMWAPHTLRNRRSPPGPVPISRRADYECYSSLAYYRLQRGGKRGKARRMPSDSFLFGSCGGSSMRYSDSSSEIPSFHTSLRIQSTKGFSSNSFNFHILLSFIPLKSHHNPDKISGQQAPSVFPDCISVYVERKSYTVHDFADMVRWR